MNQSSTESTNDLVEAVQKQIDLDQEARRKARNKRKALKRKMRQTKGRK